MRVLVCDDEQIILKLIELSFRGTPHQLRTAASGDEALDVMREWTPEVVFTDVIMPGMDGFDLARAVRSDPRLKDVPIVFMTASVRVEEIGERGVGGPTAYLSKPFGPAALRDVLASLQRGGSPGSAAS
ncbi:MAG: response regulator [Candidatus Dormibacteraeota bacterium]|nr:response regulator [Candidatus Dormibacteraeota bacterium]